MLREKKIVFWTKYFSDSTIRKDLILSIRFMTKRLTNNNARRHNYNIKLVLHIMFLTDFVLNVLPYFHIHLAEKRK